MNQARVVFATGVSILLIAGCQSPESVADGCCITDVKAVRAASLTEKAALIDRIKALEGEWLGDNEKGEKVVQSTYTVSSGGSTVREVLFPGGAHEMTNMFHMDASDLVLTHYCAAGNQPRLRSRPGDSSNKLKFKLDSVTNLQDGDTYMGELVLTIVDADTIVQDWQSFKRGQPTDKVHLEFKRRK